MLHESSGRKKFREEEKEEKEKVSACLLLPWTNEIQAERKERSSRS